MTCPAEVLRCLFTVDARSCQDETLDVSNDLRTHGLAALIVALLLLAGVQVVVMPAVATTYAIAYPEVSTLAVPYLLGVDAAILGLQIACVALYFSYLQLTRETAQQHSSTLGRIFTSSLLVAAISLGGVFGHAAFVARVGGPAMIFGLLLALALGIAAPSIRNMLFSSIAGIRSRVTVT